VALPRDLSLDYEQGAKDYVGASIPMALTSPTTPKPTTISPIVLQRSVLGRAAPAQTIDERQDDHDRDQADLREKQRLVG
jgi:hypothetical protein